jgi:hypothetical protein
VWIDVQIEQIVCHYVIIEREYCDLRICLLGRFLPEIRQIFAGVVDPDPFGSGSGSGSSLFSQSGSGFGVGSGFGLGPDPQPWVDVC